MLKCGVTLFEKQEFYYEKTYNEKDFVSAVELKDTELGKKIVNFPSGFLYQLKRNGRIGLEETFNLATGNQYKKGALGFANDLSDFVDLHNPKNIRVIGLKVVLKKNKEMLKFLKS